jgi:murein DD-endopeptidase MepM/ murein hydrolase activator NlpD
MRKPLNTIGLVLIVVLALSLGRCTPGSYPVVLASVDDFAASTQPLTTYEKSLGRWGQLTTPEGQTWLQAGEQALRDSLTVSLPFQETGQFTDSLPLALSYRVTVLPGRRFVARVGQPETDRIRYRLDLFELQPNASPRRIAHDAEANGLLSHVVTADTTTLLVRLQAPLGTRRSAFTLTLDSRPVLVEFPVQHYTISHVTSLWGQPRDGGKRRHQGIDVPAPIGTPVVAGADGVVLRVDSNSLGGRFVTLAVPKLGVALYYAHLDRQYVRPGRKVKRGQVLGTVGVTGNADTLVPHLHFGIYTGLGAVDPYPFLDTQRPKLDPATAPTERVGTLARVSANEAALRRSPNPNGPVIRTLDQGLLFHAVAATSRYYRVVLPDGTSGYLSAGRVRAVQEQPQPRTLRTATALLASPGGTTAGPLGSELLAFLPAQETVAVLGRYEEFDYVKTAAGQRGWVRRLM